MLEPMQEPILQQVDGFVQCGGTDFGSNGRPIDIQDRFGLGWARTRRVGVSMEIDLREQNRAVGTLRNSGDLASGVLPLLGIDLPVAVNLDFERCRRCHGVTPPLPLTNQSSIPSLLALSMSVSRRRG